MEVRVRKRGTDIEKIVPIKVYESLKHVYIKISDVDGSSTDEDVKKKQEQNASAQPAVVEFEKPVVVTDGVVKTLEISTDSETSEVATNDAAEYQKLTGRKPDGRWSPEKLSAKIQELKTNTNEG